MKETSLKCHFVLSHGIYFKSTSLPYMTCLLLVYTGGMPEYLVYKPILCMTGLWDSQLLRMKLGIYGMLTPYWEAIHCTCLI